MNPLTVKSFHIMFMVAWFAGLFYLPRLFVYHADLKNVETERLFCLMEKRLYYGITWPAAVLTTLAGVWLIYYNPSYYLAAGWMHAKLGLVLLLWGYHLTCGHFLKQFSRENNKKTSKFYRLFNEIPTVFLVGIVLLVVVKPF